MNKFDWEELNQDVVAEPDATQSQTDRAEFVTPPPPGLDLPIAMAFSLEDSASDGQSAMILSAT